MPDRKITDFPIFDGVPDESTYFVVASGEAGDANTANFKFDFPTLVGGVNSLVFGDSDPPIASSPGSVIFGSLDPDNPKNVILQAGDTPAIEISPDVINVYTPLHSTTDIKSDGLISGYEGYFDHSLRISGNSVLTGFDFGGDGQPVLGGDVGNVNLGGISSTALPKKINFLVGGETKMTIDTAGNTHVGEDLTVSGNFYVSGNSHFTGSADFSSSVNINSDGSFNSSGAVTLSDGFLIEKEAEFSIHTASMDPDDSLNKLYNLNGLLLWNNETLVQAPALLDTLDLYVSKDELISSLGPYALLTDLPTDNANLDNGAGYITASDIPTTVFFSDEFSNLTGIEGSNLNAPLGVDGQIITWNDTNDTFQWADPLSTLEELSNVSIDSSIADNHTLIYDGGSWRNGLNDPTLTPWFSYGPGPGSNGTDDDLVFGPQGDSSTARPLVFIYGNEEMIRIDSNGVTMGENLSFQPDSSSSDSRLKSNIQEIHGAVEKINSLKGVNFKWNKLSSQHKSGTSDIGVIAQDVQKVAPEAVKEDPNGYLSVNYYKLIPLLIQSIKEQQKEIDSLKDSVKEIKDLLNHGK